MTNKEPIVLQLIDSLVVGGAERMSVNLANSLSETGIKSFLCATRSSGTLSAFISKDVTLLILKKKSTLDLKAISSLIGFIKVNNINIIHAHSSSYFLAVVCHFFTDVKIVWHDHYGKAEQLQQRPKKVLYIGSYFFDYIISVNTLLAKWSRDNLFTNNSKISFIQNFAELSVSSNFEVSLPGSKEKRIVCLANLRPQKDHINLLNAFKEIREEFNDWHLLLVGQDNNDDYSDSIKKFIKNNNLSNSVHILGSRSDTTDILLNSSIGVLSSISEGLPVSLLEYGLANLAVVCTNVGQCKDVLGNGKYGFVVESKNSKLLADSLESMISDSVKRLDYASKFNKHINSNYSKESVIKEILSIYKSILND